MKTYFLHAQFPFLRHLLRAVCVRRLLDTMADTCIYTGCLVNRHIFFFIGSKDCISFITVQLGQ